jgi:hypothetical protein
LGNFKIKIINPNLIFINVKVRIINCVTEKNMGVLKPIQQLFSPRFQRLTSFLANQCRVSSAKGIFY